jgi:hypothetical protein
LPGRGERGKEERNKPVFDPTQHSVGHDPVAVARERRAKESNLFMTRPSIVLAMTL